MQLPSLFESADLTATRARIRYQWMVWAQLAAGVLVPAVAVGSGLWFVDAQGEPIDSPWPSSVVAGLFLLGFVLLVVEFFVQSGRVWVEARSVAETLRSLAWKFAMKAPPYSWPDTQSEDMFTRDVRDIAQRYLPIDTARKGIDPLTPQMREQRQKSFEDRCALYAKERIETQRTWYRERAGQAHRRGRRVRMLVFFLQLVGIGVALGGVADPSTFDLGVVELVSVLAASVIAWGFLQDHARTASEYDLATYDLTAALNKVPNLTEDSFPNFVADTESAMAREHVDWVARRRAQ